MAEQSYASPYMEAGFTPLSHVNETREASGMRQSSLTDAAQLGLHIVASVLIVLFAGAANAYFVAGWYVGIGGALCVEHGAMEDIQLVVMAIGVALFVFAYIKGTGAVRIGAAALAMLMAAGFVRELDIRSFGGPDWMYWLTHHGLQEILFALMSLPIPIYLWIKRRYFRELLQLALRREALFLYFAGALIVIGSVVLDRRVVHGPEMRFWEEFIEYNGYLLLTAAAWCHAWRIGDPLYSRELD